MTILSFPLKKDEYQNRGQARCLDCKYEWEAVAPESASWLECPNCHLDKGRFIGPHVPETGHDYWECRCGNDLFIVTRAGVFCPNCGIWASFP